MNYQKHYNLLIEKGKNRDSKILPYYEQHHIIPKSEGGLDDNSNLVKLTAREHFIAHWLLYRINPSIPARAFSFWRMCRGRGSTPKCHWIVISSRCYEEARLAHSKAISKALSGVKKSLEHSAKVGLALRGKKRTEEQKLKMRKKHIITKEGLDKIKETNKNKKYYTRKVIMLDKSTLDEIRNFDSLKQAALFVNLKNSNICAAIKNGSISGNYRWKYFDQESYIKKEDNTFKSRLNFIGDKNPNKSPEKREKLRLRSTGDNNHNAIKIIQSDLEGNYIKLWTCMATAAKSLNICSTNIQKCCIGKRKKAGGYTWKYNNYKHKPQ